MTIGEKIKQLRKKASLSQEELAEKLSVSRQAISKWETNRGTPDVINLQRIADIFGVTVDSLLNDEAISLERSKEKIDLSQYKKSGKCRSIYDAVVKEKYKDAEIIFPLIRRKHLNFWEWIVDFIVQPGVFWVADSLSDRSAYYLVQCKQKQKLVKVSKEYIESEDLHDHFHGRKRVIGNNLFVKAAYTL